MYLEQDATMPERCFIYVTLAALVKDNVQTGIKSPFHSQISSDYT